MKKVISTIFLCLSVCLGARAQVFILNDNIFQGRMSDIKATVLDSLTNEPVAFASVYVIPAKDTTITNFTLTDTLGVAKLEEVPFGNYVFHVEMMGYKPFVKERYFRNEEVDMGTIRMQVDEHFLQAATVTDVGNPIVVKKDTVEFSASSFRVGANAMLKDLLKRMPGMEITEDGKVKFNGEEIDKLTVGGRTFFFNDQSTALNNLPAAVVDKIRVIDRESEQTRASGLQDGNREKVLDVALKKEYEKGWFGNVGLKGGTTAGSPEGEDPLRDNRGFLYNANALVSAYTEKDQVTVIGNAQNISDSDIVVMVSGGDDDEVFSSLDQGLTTAAQLGVNANTTRIKDVETTVSVNYKYTDSDTGTRADRTTYQQDGNLASRTENTGKQYANSVNADVEFQKETGKVWFHVRPGFRYGRTESFGGSSSETRREGNLMNRSENTTRSLSDSQDAEVSADITFREVGGKTGRTIGLSGGTSDGKTGGESAENTILTLSGGQETRSMTYQSDGESSTLNGRIQYTEPLGKRWTLSTSANYTWSSRDRVRDAFDQAGRNDYYSSVSQSDYQRQQYDVTAQYKFGTGSWITVGARAIGTLNETFSKSYGIAETTGEGQWYWYVAPSLNFQYNKGINRLIVSTSAFSQRPSAERMMPVLNIANPSRLTLGNVYLKPYSYNYFSANWTRNNREKFSTLMAYFSGQLNASPITQAQWYDASGILYSIPVNARKPSLTISSFMNYSTPLDAKKNWFLTVNGSISYGSSRSYQTRKSLPGLDKDHFDYSAFLDDFWGDAEGNRFYSGASGFEESLTRTFSPYATITVRYNQERWSFSANAGINGRIARYSLDPSVNMNTMDTRFGGEVSYTTKHEFEIESDLDYVFYKGYSAGYGLPEWQWNAELTKSIGAFNLSLSVHDILNQTRNLTHTVTANYEEDSYRLVMGRYVLFGVKWNFGKMNAAHSARAQQAAMNMVF
jgi:hypothetical protein